MNTKCLVIIVSVILVANITLAQQYTSPLKKETVQFGDTTIETVIYTTDNTISKVTVTHGKRSYTTEQLYNHTRKFAISGDIDFPSKNSTEAQVLHSNSCFKTRDYSGKIVGLQADLIQFVPGVGLVGLNLPNNSEEQDMLYKGKLDMIAGASPWILDPATGKITVTPNNDMIAYSPYHRLFAKRIIYIKEQVADGSPESTKTMLGYYFENTQLQKEWSNLSVIGLPRYTGYNKPPALRYYRYLDGFVQLADLIKGDAHEISVFNNQLQLVNTYFPALVMYSNWDEMPDTNWLGKGDFLTKNYRNGLGIRPDQLFRHLVLIPNNNMEGLYGVLETDGTVSIPEDSFGLIPIITQEKYPNSKKGDTYLLNQFFLVAFPDETNTDLDFGVAGPDGKLSFGSAKDPVWDEFFIYDSDTIRNNNSKILVHPELLVARIKGGDWHCYLASRYKGVAGVSGSHSSYSFYFPTPYGIPGDTPEEAITSAEVWLTNLNNTAEQKAIERQAQLRAEGEYWRKKILEKQQREYEEWLKKNPPPAPYRGGNGTFQSKWQGFTYTAETTRRFNQTVNQSNYNNAMRQYNNYLNNRIYRSY